MSDDDGALQRMVALLREAGFTMSVGARGCCRSPWVRFDHNDETIVDHDEASFDMFADTTNT